MLGSFAVEIEDTTLGPREWRLRRARHLVAMLAMASGQNLARDRVLEALWPGQDPTTAVHNLHQAMYVARRALRHPGARDLLVLEGDQVSLCPGELVPVDVVEFEQRAAVALASDDPHLLAEADQLYAGDLLPELPYAEWAVERRQTLRAAHHAVLVRLAEAEARDGRTEAAQLGLQRVLAEDPAHEAAARASMRLLAKAGRRSAALERYEVLRDALLEAYGTDPDEQSRQLFRELLTGQGPPLPLGGRLPAPVTSFVGRARELADVEGLVGRYRLVTLTGPGGCGKTRLAVEVARTVGGDYEQGAWFVDLGALTDPRLVPDAVADALELTPGAAPSPVRSLALQLRSWRALVVLDTCEHLLPACIELADSLLAHCPGLHLLATSRQPLHVSGETSFRVPSLALPPSSGQDDGRGAVAEIASFAAVHLFVDRAREIRTDFLLTPDNVGAVARLCRSLDGIPLAIELAAARVVVLEPQEIVERLDRVLAVLASGTAGPDRHATIRATLEWSHDLLAPDEQQLLHRLSCFAGSFDLPAVEAVCGTAPLKGDLVDLLDRLIDKSLVLVVRVPGGTRYRLLDTVRQLGQEKLAAAGHTDAVASRHCAHYLAVAQRLDPDYGSARQDTVLSRFDRDHDNFRAALQWAVERSPESSLALAASLWRYWFLRCHVAEGGHWMDRVLDAAPEASVARAEALVGLTGLNARRGLSERIRYQAADAVQVMEQLDDPGGVALHQLVQATMVWATHDVTTAEAIAELVATDARALGRLDLVAASTWLRAHCALTREDDLAADRLLEACLLQLDEVDPRCPPFLAVITPCVLPVPVAGRLVPIHEESMLVGRRVGAALARSFVHAARAYPPRLRGDLGEACSAATQAVRQFDGLGDQLGRAQALNLLGCIARDDRRFVDAERHLLDSHALRHDIGDRRGEWVTRGNLALSHALQGDRAGGCEEATACLAAFEAVEDQPSIANTLGLLGALALASGDTAGARGWYSRAVTGFVHQSWPRVEAWYRILLAELCVEDGDPTAARPEVDAAETLLRLQRSRIAGERLNALRTRVDAGAQRC